MRFSRFARACPLLCALLAAAGTVRGAEATNPGVRVVLELKDGSRVEGVPAQARWPLRTELAGRQQFDLGQIASIELGKGKGAKVNFRNGDRLAAELGLEEITVKTSFGAVNVAPDLLKAIRVSAAGGARHALKFNLGNRVEVPNSPQLQFGAAPFTISLWFRTEAQRPGLSFVSKRSSAYGDGWVLHQENGQLLFYCAGCCSPRSQPVTINDGQWHYVAVVRSGSRITFWLDGKNVGAGETRCNHYDNNALRIGMDADDNTWHFPGEISEVRLYGRALNPDEIAEEWNNGAGLTSAVAGGGLIAGYHFDEGAGGTARDFSGNGHDGALINHPEWEN